MTPNEFIENCLRTESKTFEEIAERLNAIKTIRLLHAGMGLVTEAAEFLDALKKYIFYGKELDKINLAEELGDSDWYKSIASDELGISFEEMWEAVINKLAKRYGDKFNSAGAITRNLEDERQTLTEVLYEIAGPSEICKDPNCSWTKRGAGKHFVRTCKLTNELEREE